MPPSNETLDWKISSMEKQNAKEHKELSEKIDNLTNKMDILMWSMEEKFASKWVEWIVKWWVALVLTGVVWALLQKVLV